MTKDELEEARAARENNRLSTLPLVDGDLPSVFINTFTAHYQDGVLRIGFFEESMRRDELYLRANITLSLASAKSLEVAMANLISQAIVGGSDREPGVRDN